MVVRVNIGARIPEDVDQELQKIADSQGLDKSDVIRDTLKSYVDAINSNRCPECGTVNDPDAIYCKYCARGLHVKDNENLDDLLDQLKADPEKLLKLLKEAVGK